MWIQESENVNKGKAEYLHRINDYMIVQGSLKLSITTCYIRSLAASTLGVRKWMGMKVTEIRRIWVDTLKAILGRSWHGIRFMPMLWPTVVEIWYVYDRHCSSSRKLSKSRQNLPYMLLGDKVCPFLPFLMLPHPKQELNFQIRVYPFG